MRRYAITIFPSKKPVTLAIDDENLSGDWVVEVSPEAGARRAVRGLALIHAIEAHQADGVKKGWTASQSALGSHYPYAVAVVRGWRGAEVLDSGCIIGDRFSSPISLAVASVRAQWYRSSPDGDL